MEKLTIATKNAPAAIGPYAQAVRCGDMLFTSGQLGIDIHTGKLCDGVEAQTHAAMRNLGAILSEAGLNYGNIVKTVIFLENLEHFAKVNAVYESYFAAGYPARSCVQVAALPMGGKVEIECVAAL